MPVLDLTHSSDDGPHGAGAQQPAQNMPPQALQTLENAVLDCPTDTLVDTVLRLVRSNANVQRAFYAELVGVKRNRAPVAKWHTCARCGDEYDATDEDQECKYHDGTRQPLQRTPSVEQIFIGRLKVDYAAWPDHDEGAPPAGWLVTGLTRARPRLPRTYRFESEQARVS